MSSTMMFDRSMMMGPMQGSTMPMTGMPGMMPAMGNMGMVVRCDMKMEKTKDGMKITCSCPDEMSATTLQNMCKMLSDSMCSCCCMMNGMMVCQCNMTMCRVKCTDTKDGVCVTCTTGDKACCEMLHACCDCMTACMGAGCMCCLCFGGTPVCCCTY